MPSRQWKVLVNLSIILLLVVGSLSSPFASAAPPAPPAETDTEPVQAPTTSETSPTQYDQNRLSSKDIELVSTGQQTEPVSNDPALYVVELENAPVATYTGDVPGLAATSPETTGADRLDVAAAASQQYISFLEATHDQVVQQAEQDVGRPLPMVLQYTNAFNGFVVEVTPQEANAIAQISGVKEVIRDFEEELHTSNGPDFIGAPAVWDGSATVPFGLPAGTRGEGLVVGILDSGINTDHPSFADVGGDGYDHTNPRGQFYGWCNPDHPSYDPALVCNDKLIGLYSYESSGDDPEDDNGHGSHTASTTAGNVVLTATVEAPTITYTVTNISGVAPHANIISYDVCTGSSCPFTAILAGIDDAIADQVDVINYSIGGGPANPWNENDDLAFLNARTAGVMVVTSAGNSGPGAETVGSPAVAPWILAVGSSSHDQTYNNALVNMTGGDTPPPADIAGEASSGGYGPAPIVYAADVVSANADCSAPFEAGTFSGEIVICEYGSGGRVTKSINVRDGGGGGMILRSLTQWKNALMVSSYVIPTVMISFDDGQTLLDWLDSGSGHEGEITPTVVGPQVPNVMAGFSSRGPNAGVPDVLKPDVTAPGRSIIAAVHTNADNPAALPEYDVFQGTSMSSPHAAGAATLLRALYPNWTPAEIHSALMLTAVPDGVLLEDEATPAGPFARGAGLVRPDRAARASLVMDITNTEYTNANPELGGDPSSLNIPSLTDSECVGSCDWTRTLRSVTDGTVTWEVSVNAPAGMDVTVTPDTFSLNSNTETQELTIAADVNGMPVDEWVFAEVIISPTTGLTHTTEMRMPVSVYTSIGDIPESVEISTRRNAGSYLIEDLVSLEITDLQSEVHLAKAEQVQETLDSDSTSGDPFDDLSEVYSQLVEVPAGTRWLIAETLASDSPDIDLYVGRDTNGNGLPDENEVLDASTTAGSLEYVNIPNPDAGTYWVLVQNWATGQTDSSFLLATAVVPDDPSSVMTVDGPTSVPAEQPFNLRLFWDMPDAMEGDIWYGGLTLGSDADNPDNLGTIAIQLKRFADDVVKTSDVDTALPGDTVTYTITVEPSITGDNIDYTITDTIPSGLTYVPGSATGGATVNGNTLSWTGTSIFGRIYEVSDNTTDAACVVPFGTGTYIDLSLFGIFPSPTLVGDSFSASVGANGAPDGANIDFFGRSYADDELYLNADGFLSLGETTAANPGANTTIPDSADPNGLIAGFWRNLNVVYDPNTLRGVTVAGTSAEGVAGPGTSIFVEYDDVEIIGSAGSTLDFQIVAVRGVSDTSNEYVVAFDNVNLSDSLGTLGIEDLAGELGTQYGFNDLAITDGLIVCFDAVIPDPIEISYQVTVDEDVTPGTLTNEATHITDEIGSQEATASVDILAAVPPTSVSVSGPESGVIGTTQTFTASVEPDNANQPLSYTWSPAPDSGQGTATATYIFNNLGSKEVAVRVSNDYGTVEDQATIAIVDPTLDLQVSADTVAAGTVVTFDAVVDALPDGVNAVLFDFGDGSPQVAVDVPNGTTFSTDYTYTTTGEYTATATLQNSVYSNPVYGGGLARDEQAITVINGPATTLNVFAEAASLPADGTSSTPVTATLTDAFGNVVPGATVDFSTTAGSIAPATATTDASGVATSTLTAGTVAEVATVLASTGSLSDTTEVEFVAQPVAPLAVTINGSATVLVNTPYTYTATISPTDATGPLNYTWSPEPLSGQGTMTVTYAFTATGVQTISLTASNTAGSVSDALVVTVQDEPANLSVSAADASLLADGTSSTSIVAVVTNTQDEPVAGVDVTFSTTAGSIAPATATTDASGVATSTLTAGTTPGVATVLASTGSLSDTTEVEFVETIVPLAGVSIAGPTTGSANVVYTYTATLSPTNATGPLNYTWSPEPLSGQGTAMASYRFADSGPQDISLTVSADGVTVSDTQTIVINQATVGSSGGTLSITDEAGNLSFAMTIPAGAVGEDVVLRFAEQTTPTQTITPTYMFAGRAFTIQAFRGNEELDDFQFNLPVTVQIAYNTNVTTDTSRLKLFRYDEDSASWVEAAVGTYAFSNGILTTTIDHLTEFGLFVTPGTTTQIVFNVYLPIVAKE